MKVSTIVATLNGYFGGSFTESQARKHLKHAPISKALLDEAICEARRRNLILPEESRPSRFAALASFFMGLF
ncbi:MAG: hypothetical protein LIP09_13805 [Bacteroidales bacterium]|nr:hypothetical protein [Bacteroidales bacterium]MCC8119803.1 hypothetical protein [Bacteroidales bacterium]